MKDLTLRKLIEAAQSIKIDDNILDIPLVIRSEYGTKEMEFINCHVRQGNKTEFFMDFK